MHLLFATSIVPDGRLGSGYEIANEAIVAALRRQGARVTVLGFTWPDRPPSDPEQTIVLGSADVRTDQASTLRKLRWLMRAMREELTFSSAKLRIVDEDAVRRAIRAAGPIDGYVLNSVQLAGAFESCFADKPFLFVAHNVEAQSALENAASSKDPFQRFLFRREARLLKTLETRLCAAARFVFTLAEEDRAALGLQSSEKSAALPLVTRSTIDEPSASLAAPAYDAGLIGTWTWQPNRVGLDWFLDEVAPHLPASFTTRIAGSAPAGLSSGHPGISFVGRVPSAHEFVMGASVIPLVSRGGTGVQLKTIETFELGLPSVATSSALRGIDHLPDNCTVADDPRAFAEALRKAAAGRRRIVDGRQFHLRQRAALDRALGRGLEFLEPARVGIFA